MKIHYCNCASFCPLHSNYLIPKFVPELNNLVTQCLILESSDGVILVDTGIGLKQMNEKRNILQDFVIGTEYNPENSMYKQLEKKGIKPQDVRHIFVTHLDYDHAGGLAEFPQAKLHVSKKEWDIANFSHHKRDQLRYKKRLWEDHREQILYSDEGEKWIDGLLKVPMKGINEKLFLIPLNGHTKGHMGIYIEKENLLFAGDAFMYHKQIENNFDSKILSLYNRITSFDINQYYLTLDKLKSLHKENIKIINSHDHYYLRNESNDISS